MAKNKKTINPNLARLKHPYTIAGITEIFPITKGTAQNWRKQGLKPIDDTSKPYIFMGAEIRRFLKERRQKRRYKLKDDEFFCPKCRSPRKSRPGGISVEYTHRRLGKIARQALIKGICELCGQKMIRFSSDIQVRKLLEAWPALSEHLKGLCGSDGSSVNNNLKEVENE